MKKTLRVSIVIPVYNESDTIDRCLQAIANQTVMPYEVIVVDNNSSDGTAAIAQRYPFVRVIREPKQGVVYARNTGFNAVNGDIIGRIDADTIVDYTWVETVQHLFARRTLGAVSGSMRYHNVPFANAFSLLDSLLRGYLAVVLGREYALQAANMALRTSAWKYSRKLVCIAGAMHEDFDLGIHLREAGYTTRYTPELIASVIFRQAGSKWTDFKDYVVMNPGTYAQHNRWRHVLMWPVMILALASYPMLHILFLGYDAETDTFSWRRLWNSNNVSRVNPATFVD